MSPAVDLRAILTPIIEGVVAPTIFPDTVVIESPVATQDDTGDPAFTWDTVDSGVPAVIAPVRGSTNSMFLNVPILQTDVTILLAGDRDVHPDYRIRVEYVPPADPDPRVADRWDVVAVTRDEARVTTTVLGRARAPGTPDEGS